jgi:hypothetical protein
VDIHQTGIENYGIMNIISCTILSIYHGIVVNDGSISILNCTIIDNYIGLINSTNDSSKLSIGNSALDNELNDVDQNSSIVSLGNNVSSAIKFTNPTDKTGTDPKLDNLNDNGGYSLTMSCTENSMVKIFKNALKPNVHLLDAQHPVVPLMDSYFTKDHIIKLKILIHRIVAFYAESYLDKK